MNPCMTATADKIKTLRRDHGLTQEDLADRSGVGIATIQRAEGGKPLSASSLASIAAAFGIPATALAADENSSFEPYLPLVAVTSGRALIALLLGCRRLDFDFCELDNLDDAKAIEAFHDFSHSIMGLEAPLAPIALVTRELEARDQLAALGALGFRVGGANFDITIYEVDEEFGNGPSVVYGCWDEHCAALMVGRDNDDIGRAHVGRRLGKYESVKDDAIISPPQEEREMDWGNLFGPPTSEQEVSQ